MESTRFTPETAASPQPLTISVSAIPTVTARSCSTINGRISATNALPVNSGFCSVRAWLLMCFSCKVFLFFLWDFKRLELFFYRFFLCGKFGIQGQNTFGWAGCNTFAAGNAIFIDHLCQTVLHLDGRGRTDTCTLAAGDTSAVANGHHLFAHIVVGTGNRNPLIFRDNSDTSSGTGFGTLAAARAFFSVHHRITIHHGDGTVITGRSTISKSKATKPAATVTPVITGCCPTGRNAR